MPGLDDLEAQTIAELNGGMQTPGEQAFPGLDQLEMEARAQLRPMSAPIGTISPELPRQTLGDSFAQVTAEGGGLGGYLKAALGHAAVLPGTGISGADIMAGAEQGRNDLLVLASRLAGDSIGARSLERQSEVAGGGADLISDGVMSRAARGATRSLVPMVMTMGGGPALPIATAAGISGASAVSEAEDAGLTGADKAAYITRAATIEALPALVFQRLGLGGVEKALGEAFRGPAREGVKQALKQAGRQTFAGELPEEYITAAAEIANQKLSGVDTSALTAEQIAETFRDVTLQTLMMGGAANAPSVVRGARNDLADARVRDQEMAAMALEGMTPDRSQMVLDPATGEYFQPAMITTPREQPQEVTPEMAQTAQQLPELLDLYGMRGLSDVTRQVDDAGLQRLANEATNPQAQTLEDQESEAAIEQEAALADEQAADNQVRQQFEDRQAFIGRMQEGRRAARDRREADEAKDAQWRAHVAQQLRQKRTGKVERKQIPNPYTVEREQQQAARVEAARMENEQRAQALAAEEVNTTQEAPAARPPVEPDSIPQPAAVSVPPSPQIVPPAAEEGTIEGTTEDPIAAFDAETKQLRERTQEQLNRTTDARQREYLSGQMKGTAMRRAAERRAMIQGDTFDSVDGGMTGKEISTARQAAAAFERGRPVTVKGRKGKISSGNASFGRHQVEFEDGTVASITHQDLLRENPPRDRIVGAKPRRPNPAPDTPQSSNARPTTTGAAPASSSTASRPASVTVRSVADLDRGFREVYGLKPDESAAATALVRARAAALGEDADAFAARTIREVRQGKGSSDSLMQDGARLMPQTESLEFDRLKRTWEKAHGRRLEPQSETWQQLERRAAEVDRERGVLYQGGEADTIEVDGKQRSTLNSDGHVSLAVFDPSQVKSVIGNFGTFDRSTPNILHQDNLKDAPKDATGKRTEKGAISFADDGKAVIHALQAPDVSTAVHELGHLFRRTLSDAEEAAAARWAGAKQQGDGKWSWGRNAEEKFARGFERYLRDGTAPNKPLQRVFGKLRDWLRTIYQAIKGSPIDIQITPEIRAAFDKMLTPKDSRQAQRLEEGIRADENRASQRETQPAEAPAPAVEESTPKGEKPSTPVTGDAKSVRDAVAKAMSTDGKPAMSQWRVSTIDRKDSRLLNDTQAAAVFDPLLNTVQVANDATADQAQAIARGSKAKDLDLAGKSIDIQNDAGTTQKIDASEAVAEVRKRVSALRALLDCVGG